MECFYSFSVPRRSSSRSYGVLAGDEVAIHQRQGALDRFLTRRSFIHQKAFSLTCSASPQRTYSPFFNHQLVYPSSQTPEEFLIVHLPLPSDSCSFLQGMLISCNFPTFGCLHLISLPLDPRVITFMHRFPAPFSSIYEITMIRSCLL